MKTDIPEGAPVSAVESQGELFALVWRHPRHPFRLRVNDIIRIDGRLGRIVRVTECAAVVLVNQPMREFKTRFDKPVRFRPQPALIRISANSETEILNRRKIKARRGSIGREWFENLL